MYGGIDGHRVPQDVLLRFLVVDQRLWGDLGLHRVLVNKGGIVDAGPIRANKGLGRWRSH